MTETLFYAFIVNDTENDCPDSPDFIMIPADRGYDEATDEATDIGARHYSRPVEVEYWNMWDQDDIDELGDFYVFDFFEW